VVQDKLWLPGLLKLRMLRDAGFFGRILSVRGEFGYWVFEGDLQPAQRPSWNYRKEDGGGIILDMLCHWRYVLDNVFSPVKSVSRSSRHSYSAALGRARRAYAATADDAAYATLNSPTAPLCRSTVRGACACGATICSLSGGWHAWLRRCRAHRMLDSGTGQCSEAGMESRRPSDPHDFYADWSPVPDTRVYQNAFKVQWELFPVTYGAKATSSGTCWRVPKVSSWSNSACAVGMKRRWVDVPDWKVEYGRAQADRHEWTNRSLHFGTQLGPLLLVRNRHIFRAPTRFYKSGIVFMAWLNDHQDHFVMGTGNRARAVWRITSCSAWQTSRAAAEAGACRRTCAACSGLRRRRVSLPDPALLSLNTATVRQQCETGSDHRRLRAAGFGAFRRGEIKWRNWVCRRPLGAFERMD
jgi:hypothetical protein